MQQSIKSFIRGMILLTIFWAPALFAQGISVNLGKTEIGRYLKLVGNVPGGDGQISNSFLNSEYCAENVSTSMYFKLDENYMNQLTNRHIIVNVEYFDEPGVQIKLVYDAIDSPEKESDISIQTEGSNMWRSFGFYLDDCYFGHRLANDADFKLVSSNKMHVNAITVVPIDYYFDWGVVNDSLGITQVEIQGGDSKTQITEIGGEEAIATTVNNNYIYCDVSDTLVYGGNHPVIFVSVQYYDFDPSYSMRLQYDASGNSYQNTGSVAGRGWNCWRTATFELSDALFSSSENGRADFRLLIPKMGLPINRIMIALINKDPLPIPPGRPTFASHKVLESPVIDGDLHDWDWMLRGNLLEETYTNGKRTDEFYRTWLLEPSNVPVVEAGEPNVIDPGISGDWDLEDLSGEVKCVWDDSNIYFSANVKDNVLDVNGNSSDEKDGFGVYFDVSHTILDGHPLANFDDFTFQLGEHYFFFPADNTDQGTWIHQASQTGEGLPAGAQKFFKSTTDGYIMEVSIPLAALKEGLVWNPGVADDPDNFNPLFGYVVNDADNVGPSSGKLAYGAPNADDENWASISFEPYAMVDQGPIIDFGTTNFEQFITQVEKGGDGKIDVVAKGGKTCAQLSNGYAYFNVSDEVINTATHPHLLLMMEYFDEASTGRFRVQYNSITAPYQDGNWTNLTGSGTWKTAIMEITDAQFNNLQNGGADFRINSEGNNLIINQIRIGIADIWIDRGSTTTSSYITPNNAQSDGVTQSLVIGGVDCQRNSVLDGGGRYFYCFVDDSVMFEGNHPDIFLTIEYYDTTSSTGVGLNYDGTSTQWANGQGNALIMGTNQWKLHTFYITDAWFANRENGNSDFRVQGNGEDYTFINRVMIGSLTPLSFPTGVSDGTTPLSFDLMQNYPNPFNPTTAIKYQLPESGMVTLKVINILGQEVAILENGYKAAGVHTLNWNASNMPSGVYIYTITHNNNVMTKKMMLVK